LIRAPIFTVLAAILCIFAGCSSKTSNQQEQKVEHTAMIEETPEIEDSRPILVTFGDSLTEGAGVNPALNYPAKLQIRIDAAGYDYRVVNEGVSGDTSAQGLNRTGAVIALKPAIVIVEFGANDGLRGIPVDTTRRNLEEIISKLQAAGIQVVLAGMEMPPNYGPAYTNAFREIFTSVSQAAHIPLIPFFLEGVGGHPELNQDDGIHPTAEGYDIVVANVWKTLEPILKHRKTQR
jgi:acyl-CoA thioesterase-1